LKNTKIKSKNRYNTNIDLQPNAFDKNINWTSTAIAYLIDSERAEVDRTERNPSIEGPIW